MTASSRNNQADRIETGFRRHVLLPLAIALPVLVVLALGGFHWYAENQIDRQIRTQADRAARLFRLEWERDAYLLGNLIESLQEDPCIREAYQAGDRERLLRCTEEDYRDLRRKYRITHFYFHGSDKVNFLRVHHPPRHGDLIQRVTLDQAAATGATSRGLELGVFGTFTLRVVRPWHIDGRLVGYIELGEEIEHFTIRLKQILDMDLLFLIHKEFVTRGQWEEGQRMLGHHEDWDEYPDYVVIDRTMHLWLPNQHSYLMHPHENARHYPVSFDVSAEGRSLHIIALPLMDAGERNVGHILSVTDVTEPKNRMFRAIGYLIALSLLLAGLLWIVFRRYFKRYQGAVASAQNHWQQIADALQEKNQALLSRQETLIRERRQYQRITLEEQTLGVLQNLALQPTGMEEYLRESLARIIESTPWIDHLPEAVVFLVESHDGGKRLRLAAHHNFSPQLQQLCAQLPFGTCLCGRAAAQRNMLFCSGVDARHEIQFDGMVPHGHYVVPLLQGDELLGVFNLYLPNGVSHNEQDEAFMSRIGEVLALGIARRQHGTTAAPALPTGSDP